MPIIHARQKTLREVNHSPSLGECWNSSSSLTHLISKVFFLLACTESWLFYLCCRAPQKHGGPAAVQGGPAAVQGGPAAVQGRSAALQGGPTTVPGSRKFFRGLFKGQDFTIAKVFQKA